MILELQGIEKSFGGVRALRGVDFGVAAGEIVGLVGGNGAGKSTMMKIAAGIHQPDKGSVKIDGRTPSSPADAMKLGVSLVRQGLVMVPEGRGVFARMSIVENLQMGAYVREDGEIDADMANVFGVFPRLKERAAQLAGTLSGGEQQMLAMGRALMARPKVLLMDEPSMGLAPLMVDKIFEVVGDIHSRGTTILLVEQNASRALQLANRGYVMESGEITMSGEAKALLDDPKVRAAYLGE